MREDVSKNCGDCENKMPYLLRHVPENPALAHMSERCNQCVFGKYRNPESVRNDNSVELNLLDTYSKTVKIKNPKPISL